MSEWVCSSSTGFTKKYCLLIWYTVATLSVELWSGLAKSYRLTSLNFPIFKTISMNVLPWCLFNVANIDFLSGIAKANIILSIGERKWENGKGTFKLAHINLNSEQQISFCFFRRPTSSTEAHLYVHVQISDMGSISMKREYVWKWT